MCTQRVRNSKGGASTGAAFIFKGCKKLKASGEGTLCNNSIQKWYSSILERMKAYIPTTKTKTTQKVITNNTIKNTQESLKRLFETANKHGWTHAKYKAYKILKQLLIKKNKIKHNKNWEEQITNLTHLYKTPREFWEQIKTYKRNKNTTSSYLLHNNMRIFTGEEKEKTFRTILRETFKISLQENLQFDTTPYKQPRQTHTTRSRRHHKTKQRFTHIQNHKERHSIQHKKKLKNNTPGYSKINKAILSNLPEEAINTLTKLLNLSLFMGYFPQEFKQANIKMIPKPNKPSSNPNIYRPISLLEVPGKIYDKIINKRLRGHLKLHNMLLEAQHGFRSSRSTDTTLAITTEKIAQAMVRKQ